MIIMPVPKDVRKFEPKFIGPLTKRQTFSVIPACVVAWVIYGLFGRIADPNSLVIAIALVDIPILAFGFIDVYGMPLYVYAKDILLQKIFAPKYRPYSTENVYRKYAKQTKITYEFFDGDMTEYEGKRLKRKQKENKKRLERFLKDNPELKPIE